jgi:hypothetical protein
MPGEPIADVQATLVQVLDDEQISVTQLSEPVLTPSVLHKEIIQAIEKVTGELWPGIPSIPCD